MSGDTVLPSRHPDLPTVVVESPLWQKMGKNQEYSHTLSCIRKIASALAEKISSTLPEYTDHSVKHMDSLWRISGEVLTQREIERFSASEAFLLGASFYVHDLGMAAAVTNAGKEEIRGTKEYRASFERFQKLYTNLSRADELAIREASRELHARRALEFTTAKLPGLDQYLIEDSEFRSRWGHTIGQIAESHHWSLEEVERSLGSRNATPSPDGDSLDLGYVACMLRIIDFAHIDRARAPRIERLLRSEIPSKSAIHWDAQANITGPRRDGDYLCFGCTEPLKEINAWWLFYDLSSGLDAEIRGVDDYIRNRTVSKDRFSLKGVKGVESPEIFSQFIRLAEGILPIDIRVQPNSMERIVELLGGRHIYGRDKFAPIRELIQNARDAIELRSALERAEGHAHTIGEITVSVERSGEDYWLLVRDNGVGMTRSVVRNHLVGVGSDFWNSVDFYRQYSKAIDAGFRPIGKFGIGFLSVFMLGDHIEVKTEAIGSKRILLALEGVGRRGELREKESSGQFGTEVRILLKEGGDELSKNLPGVVRARAPMLMIPIVVNVVDGGTTLTERIEPSWWKNSSADEVANFVRNWHLVAYRVIDRDKQAQHADARWLDDYFAHAYTEAFGGKLSLKGWPGARPEHIDELHHLISAGGMESYGVIRCSQGIAVDCLRVPDITGLVELGPVELTVSRESLLDSGRSLSESRRMAPDPLIGMVTAKIRPAVITKVDELQAFGMLPGRLAFLRGLTSIFGEELLSGTALKWIPTTEPPGDLIHRSKVDFYQLLKRHSRMMLAVGASAAGAYQRAAVFIRLEELAELLVVAIPLDEVDVGYEIKRSLEREVPGGIIKDTLDNVLAKASQDEKNLFLTRFLVQCIAEGWDTSIDLLRKQNWYLHYENNILWADLRKL